MRLADSRTEARFRADLLAWLDDNQPPADRVADRPRSPGHVPGWARAWQRHLFSAGWLVPRWPPESGGRDATAVEQLIYLEELARRRVPRTTNPHGLDVCAPILVEHGTAAQHDTWLQPTLHGELSWCVAVAEVDRDSGGAERTPGVPPAGGVALVEGDGGPQLRGSIPAPVGAGDADRCLCEARVVAGAGDAGEAAEATVVVVAVDLAAPGVRRPAAPADRGGAAGAVLAFDGVAVDEVELVGGREGGWPVVRSVRARLRSLRWITNLLEAGRALAALAELGAGRGLADDAVFRDALAGLHVEVQSVRALAYRALARQSTGRPNPELAMLPLATSQAVEQVLLTGVETLGADGLDLGIDGPGGWAGPAWATAWRETVAESVRAGGAVGERERVAARVLGTRRARSEA